MSVEEEWMQRTDQVTYRDLVIFEERLRGNMTRLQRRRRKYEAFLLGIFILLFYFFYVVFLVPSKDFSIHLMNTSALLVTAGSLVFIYRSGIYFEKIVFASEFVTHSNRALRPFNLQFNRRGNGGVLSFYRRIPRELQQGFDAYRRQYQARQRLRLSKQKAS
ncbi:Spo7-like protein-domain-containing protein [Dichotomocladium elegans]|nr:Spo7-like protein-domain-containing protein [Dichotomocladium elegans]